MKDKLTPKQQKFVDAVSTGVGHSQAAIAAGYSAKSARTLAARLLQDVAVRTALEERQAYYRSIADVEAAEVIGAQKEMAFASIEDALDDNGFLDFQKAKENGAAKLIKKISRQQTKYGETVAVEFYSRSDALNQLADILGLKQQAKPNAETIEKAARAYAEWLADNPTASDSDRDLWLQRFAKGANVEPSNLARKVDHQIDSVQ